MCELTVCGKEAISFFFRMHGVIGNLGSAKLFFYLYNLKGLLSFFFLLKIEFGPPYSLSYAENLMPKHKLLQ